MLCLCVCVFFLCRWWMVLLCVGYRCQVNLCCVFDRSAIFDWYVVFCIFFFFKSIVGLVRSGDAWRRVFFFWLIGIRGCSKVQWCFNHSWKMFSLFLLLNVRMRLLTYVDVWWWFEVRKMWYFCVCRNFMRIRKSKNLKFLPSCFVWLVIFLRIAEVVSNAEKNRPNSCCNYQKVFFFFKRFCFLFEIGR